MSNPSGSSDRHVIDAVWAEYGVGASGDRPPSAALAWVAGAAGLLPGAGVYHALTRLRGRTGSTAGERSATPSGSAMYVFYESLPEPLSPAEIALEERLLFHCQQDRQL